MKIAKLVSAIVIGIILVGGNFVSSAATGSNTSPIIWNSTFYNNDYLGEPYVLSRQDSNLSFNWGTGSPADVVNSDHFSARFTTMVAFSSGYYRFRVLADDGIRVIIDNSITLIDTFFAPQPNQIIIADVNMAAGVHNIQVDYREVTGSAALQVGWEPINNPGNAINVPPATSGVER